MCPQQTVSEASGAWVLNPQMKAVVHPTIQRQPTIKAGMLTVPGLLSTIATTNYPTSDCDVMAQGMKMVTSSVRTLNIPRRRLLDIASGSTLHSTSLLRTCGDWREEARSLNIGMGLFFAACK